MAQHRSMEYVSNEDNRKYFGSQEEVDAASRIIEERTRDDMRRQKELLEHWFEGAVAVQKIWHGYKGRKRFRKLRAKIEQQKADEAKRQAAFWRYMKRDLATRKIVLHIKRYVVICIIFKQSVKVLQRSMRLFLFRCRRYHARIKIENWYKVRGYRRRILIGLWKLRTRVYEKKRNEQANIAGLHFQNIRDKQKQSRQEAYNHIKPEAVLLQRLLNDRKNTIVMKKVTKKAHKINTSNRIFPTLDVPLASNTMMALSKSNSIHQTNTYTVRGGNAQWMKTKKR